MHNNTCYHILEAHDNIQNSLLGKEIGELTKARDVDGEHCFKTSGIYYFPFHAVSFGWYWSVLLVDIVDCLNW